MKQHTTLSNNSVPRIERHINPIEDHTLFVVPKGRWIASFENKENYESFMRSKGGKALSMDAESIVRTCYEETGHELPKEIKHFPPNGQAEFTFHKDTGKLIRVDVFNHHICFMEFADEDTHSQWNLPK